jgi:hypothetical protein
VQAVRPKPAAVPQHEVQVGNVRVPMRPDQITGDPAAAAEAELTLRGGRGDAAQGVGQGFADQQGARMQQAGDEIAAGLDPSGRSAGMAPQDAGARVIDELIDNEARRLSTEQAGVARAAAEGGRVRADLGGQPIDPATGQPRIVADSPYAAGETIGPGVTAARDRIVAERNQRYQDLANAPGTFDPEFVGGLSGDIRGRLASGDNPLHVDPQTTAKADQALRILDSLGGTGIFHNAAGRAPVGPVAQAAGGTEAERALNELVARGINPDKARAAVADLPGGQALRGHLEPHEVSTPDGKSVRVMPIVAEASELRTSGDAGYDKTLQPRNRARAASQVQINDMAKNLNPNRLGVSSEADRGAPIVGPDGMVESGNGRVQAIRQAYAENGPAAERSRAWLQSQGVDVSKYREPILVRGRTTSMTPQERQAFTVSANQSATLSLSAAERALADSRSLSPEVLSLIRNPADLGAADNRDFVRAFMRTVPQSEQAALMTANGELSSEGLGRIRNAVLAKAYGDSPVLTRVAESAHDDIKSISNGLSAAAPEWAALRARVAAGEVPAGLDVTKDLIDAVNRTAAIRGRGVGLAESHAQADAFAHTSPESEALQRLFYGADGKGAASAQQVANALRSYAQEASKVNAAPGLDLGLAPVKAGDILKTVAGKVGAPAELAQEVKEATAAAQAAAPAEKGPPIGEVSLKQMDQARKRLVTLYGDARRAAMGPGGQQADVRAMGRVLHEYDQAILDAFEQGRFSGDSETAARLLRDARASHALYRQTFTSRGGQDPTGRAVEKILGRYADTAATPEEVARLSYGSQAEPGGGEAIRNAQRLRTILGETSPEWGAYKQGLFSYLVDSPPGSAPRSASEVAGRIEKFLDGTKGRGLAQAVLSADERAALRTHAANLRASEPVPLSSLNDVDRLVARIAGRDGMPATPGEVVDLLYSRTGTGTKAISVRLAARLKRELSPEGWTAVRQGMWQKLTNAGEGKIEFGPQALSQRLHEFLNESGKGLATVLFSPAERAQMASLAKAYRQMVPPKGTTNPSGTAPMLARIANKASSNVVALLGGIHGGFPGAAIGLGVEKAGRAAIGARNVRRATPLFYGPQPRPAARSSRVPIVLGQSAAPQVADQ